MSGYVLAGVRGFHILMSMFHDGRRGNFNNHFTDENMSKFLSTSCAGFLHSYGETFHNTKKLHRYSQKELKILKGIKETPFFDNTNLILDSGGFQISCGILDRFECDKLLNNMYYDYLEEACDYYDRAFILDIPPGPGCQIFNSFKDVSRLNRESYQKAANLPKHVRDKIIYIHHFRTPKLWDIYMDILRNDNMFDKFNYHATGGVASNMKGDLSIKIIIYTLPLIPLINEAKKHNRKVLNFHILGGATFRDILFYELCKKVVEKEHGIKLNITFDSSGPFKQLMISRFLFVLDDQRYLKKMDIRKGNLDKKFLNDMTVYDKFQEILNEMSDSNNFKRIPLNGVYGMYKDRSGNDIETLHQEIKIYSILYMLHLNAVMEQQLKEDADRIYPLYESGQLKEFYKECFEITRHINQGKITSKQTIKSQSIPKSLDLLKSLDEDYCKYVVNKCLSKDEFTNLESKSRILTL